MLRHLLTLFLVIWSCTAHADRLNRFSGHLGAHPQCPFVNESNSWAEYLDPSLRAERTIRHFMVFFDDLPEIERVDYQGRADPLGTILAGSWYSVSYICPPRFLESDMNRAGQCAWRVYGYDESLQCQQANYSVVTPDPLGRASFNIGSRTFVIEESGDVFIVIERRNIGEVSRQYSRVGYVICHMLMYELAPTRFSTAIHRSCPMR